jgi:hypothetical protein
MAAPLPAPAREDSDGLKVGDRKGGDIMRALQQPDEVEPLYSEMIRCSRQPGKLRLFKHACAQRYLKAQKTPRNTFGRGGATSVKWSLELCRTCPEGRRHAKEITSAAAAAEQDMKPREHA